MWATYDCTSYDLEAARIIYKHTGKVHESWPFHPAYVYGNNRVSCKFCVLADINDLMVGAAHDEEGILDELIAMEVESGFTFKQGWSISSLKKAS